MYVQAYVQKPEARRVNKQQLKSKIQEVQTSDQPRKAIGLGGGLYCSVNRDSVSWLVKYRIGGEVRSVGLGRYAKVSMAKAVKDAKDACDLVSAGFDPKQVKTQRAAEANAAATASVTFKELVALYVAAGKLNHFKADKTRREWLAGMATLDGTLGRLPVRSTTHVQVADAIKPVWHKRQSARQLLRRVVKVMSYGASLGLRDPKQANPASLNLVVELLPSDKAPAVVKRPALDWKEVPKFMGELRKTDGPVARCLETLILTASRRSEILYLTRSEVDLEARRISLPGERMKMGLPHIIPLSDRAVGILTPLCAEGMPKLLFQGADVGSPFGPGKLNRLLADMRPGVTVHGFRSSFRDWCDESGQHAGASESCLAHVKGGTEGAYLRTSRFEKRVVIMAQWADYCERGAADNVSRLHAAA